MEEFEHRLDWMMTVLLWYGFHTILDKVQVDSAALQISFEELVSCCNRTLYLTTVGGSIPTNIHHGLVTIYLSMPQAQ